LVASPGLVVVGKLGLRVEGFIDGVQDFVASLVSGYARIRDGEWLRDGVSGRLGVALLVVPAAPHRLPGGGIDDGDLDPEVPMPVAGHQDTGCDRAEPLPAVLSTGGLRNL
jgi:hypothetical protein